MPMVSLSTNVIWRPRPPSARWRAAMMPAVSHPAVPPPTMQIDRTGLTMAYCSPPRRRQCAIYTSSEVGANADLPPAPAIFRGEELVLVVRVLQKILIGQILTFHENP